MIESAEGSHASSDGYRSWTSTWTPAADVRGRILLLHGVQSHGGWYGSLGGVLASRGYETVIPDRRGSGRNTVDRGHTPTAGRLVEDVVELLRRFRATGPPVPTALAGISWGGKLALIAAGERPDLVDALALICPGLRAKVDPPLGERLGIAWAYFTDPRKQFPIPLADPALFTSSPEGQAFIASDPLALRSASASLLAASRFIDRRVRRARGRVSQPTLLMLAGRDRIVDNAATLLDFERFGTANRTLIEYPEGHHTLEFDPDPSRYALDLADWLDRTLLDQRGPGLATD